MVRLSPSFIAVLASCAHGVSEPNPPTPAPHLGPPYAGRIVLQTTALRDRVEGFASVWTKRIALLGATAKITYDDDRGVVDVYDVAPDQLERVSRVLADPGVTLIDGMPIDGDVMTWIAPDAHCDCSGRVRVMLDDGVLCSLANGAHVIERNGLRAQVRTTRYWYVKGSNRYVDTPPEPGGCRTETYWLHNVVVELAPGSSQPANLDTVLALGGGTLPAIPHIASVTGGAP